VKRRRATSRKPAKTQPPIKAKRSATSKTARQTNLSISDLQEQLKRQADELEEAREERAAIAEVLRVISSSPGELELVFQAMLANAVRICDARFGYLQLHENGAFRMGAMYNPPPAWAQAIAQRGPLRPGPLSNLGRVAATKQVVHTADYADVHEQVGGDRQLWRRVARRVCFTLGWACLAHDAVDPCFPLKSNVMLFESQAIVTWR